MFFVYSLALRASGFVFFERVGGQKLLLIRNCGSAILGVAAWDALCRLPIVADRFCNILAMHCNSFHADMAVSGGVRGLGFCKGF